MTATVLPRAPRGFSGIARRRLQVLLELLLAVAICLVGYYVGADWFRVREAAWTVDLLHLFGQHDVSSVLAGNILIFRADGGQLTGAVTTSCSSVLTVVGLTALTAAVLRERRWHAVGGLLVAAAAVVAANELRLVASVLAGQWWGEPAMVLFHDWVGTVWTLAATIGGFLLMVCLALPHAERAEQNVAGRHTARRPNSWARPGLGYRVAELDERPSSGRRSLTGLLHRYVLPRGFSRRLAARREASRVDYRLGHLPADERIDRIRALVSHGLGAHTASLLAVATYDEDPAVLDALAGAIAARQWEPVTNDRVAGLRLWARGRLQGRPPTAGDESLPGPGADSPVPASARPPVPVRALPTMSAPVPLLGSAAVPHRPAAADVPTGVPLRSFARPARDAAPHTPEDPR